MWVNVTLQVTELCEKDLGDHLRAKRHHLSLYDKLELARDVCKG